VAPQCLLHLCSHKHGLGIIIVLKKDNSCHNHTLKECEDDTHTPEMGTWESFRTLKIQSSIVGVKTPRLEVFFVPLEILEV
jgi:hypothetical protein